MKTTLTIINLAILILVFGCLALSPIARAVLPAPDGGYPGANTAEGDNALLNLTTGAYNTAVGFGSLRALTTGNLNTATGADALLVNTASENTATGAGALLSNTTGGFNTANGAFALESNTEGSSNTAVGALALSSNTSTNGNTAVGYQALFHTGDGEYNTANGYMALVGNRIGFENTAMGDHALANNNIGDHNTAVGSYALAVYTGNGTGGGTTAVGAGALDQDTTGMGNTAVGASAGNNVTTANNVICVGAVGNNISNSCYIGNIFGATSSGGSAVFVNSNGRLGTMTSSRRFKDEIKPMDRVSEGLFSLQPVTFRYKKEVDPEGDGKSQYGLLAEEVAEVNPDLVVRDKEGKPYSVRYDQVNAMLLNEFLKEHRAFLEEQRKVEKLETEVAALATGLQKVTAQVERSQSAPRTLLSSP